MNDKTVVCIKHFEPKFVVREDIFPVENSEPIRVPRKIPKVTNDAYPTIFPNQPSYHTVPVPKERKNSEERFQQLLECDACSFNTWCEMTIYLVQKRNVHPFTILVKANYVSFIKLKDDSLSDVPLVSVCLKISSSLEVQVCHKNVCLPTETFKWILQSGEQENLKYDKWTKFYNLVSHLNGFIHNSIGTIDKVINLISVLKQAMKEGSDFDDDVPLKCLFWSN